MRRALRTWRALAILGIVAAGISTAPPSTVAQTTDPTITVEPSTDLLDGTQVTLTIAGLQPSSWGYALQCISGSEDFSGCDTSDLVFLQPDTAGAATATLRVDAMLVTRVYDPEDPEGPGQTVETDCRESGACVVAVLAEGGLATSAPLHFVADGSLAPPPVVTAEPDEPLTDGQTVTVNASGLVWSTQALVVHCVAEPTSPEDCDYATASYVDLAEDTGFTQDYRVSALIETPTHGTVDCREVGGCALAVTSGSELSPAKTGLVSLTFDPDAEVVPPTLTVSPDVDLVDGQTVNVDGSGFNSDRPWVDLLLCGSELSWDSCQWVEAFPTLDENGAFNVDVQLAALLAFEGGDELDCRASAEPCHLVGTQGSLPSVHAASASLHFDPDAPLLPGPTIVVDPSTNLPEVSTVSVTGSSFGSQGWESAHLRVCAAGDDTRCDPQSEAWVAPDAAGDFSVGLDVAATFSPQGGEPVDCRAVPGCEVIARDEVKRRSTSTALAFAPPAPALRRYFDPVFDQVDITRDVVYRETVDAAGNPVELKLDVYQPTGDTATVRPAVVWMEGGWFSSEPGGDTTDMAAYADAFARRGYVAVTMEYRTRPELHCCPAEDPIGITEAILDAHDDALAGVEWLHHHAADYRIDPEAIAAGGAEAGATSALGLAYHPSDDGGGGGGGHDGGHDGDDGGMDPHPMSDMDDSDSPMVAAALAISGVSFGRPEAGAPPVLAFNGADAATAPLHLSQWTCDAATRMGTRCDVAGYDGAQDDIGTRKQRDIVRRSADFLAEVVLGPLGYLDSPPSPPGQPTTTTTEPAAPPDGNDDGAGAGNGAGSANLARTGTNALPALARIGLALAALGAGLVLASAWRRRHGQRVVPASPSGASSRRRPRTFTGTALVGIAGLLLAMLAVPGDASEAPHAADAAAVDEAAESDSGSDSEQPGEMDSEDMDPGHEDPPPDDPGHDPGFPDDWTPEQVAFAEALIHDTEMTLPRYGNPAILPLLGYTWIFDGSEVGSYQHWINLRLIGNPTTLDPEFPESLVFRNTDDGPVLEAAMFILSSGTLDTIPEDIAFLPGWHIHDNLCFDNRFHVVGIAVDGVCAVGTLFVTPPMVHVWVVDTPCGRFAGVDENGLICHHEDH